MSKRGSYRIQLRIDFPFDAATSNVGYWQRLGISHIYCSPYLQATCGSAHGYDVVNHAAVNDELGGKEARSTFCDALSSTDYCSCWTSCPITWPFGVDTMRGGGTFWKNGPSSRYSSYFDVEWRTSGPERVLLPILADQYGVELDAGKIILERVGHEVRVRYGEHINPLAPRAWRISSASRGEGARSTVFFRG